MNAILDTTVIIHLLRRYKPALAWFNNPQIYGVTTTTCLEVLAGSISKIHQAEAENILDQFELLYCTASDQAWAIQQVKRFQFRHHIGANDCLIAAVAYRLQVPLYTHNLKDMTPLIGALAIQPYS